MKISIFRSCPIILLLLFNFVFAQDNFNIEKVGSAFVSTRPQDYNIVDDYVYCADEYGLSVWDISEAEEPLKIGQCVVGGIATRLDISGDYAYVYSHWNKISVVDISDPEIPAVVNKFAVIYGGYFDPDLKVHEDYLYICAGGANLYVASLEDPARPDIIGNYRFHRTITMDILFSGNIAYVLSGDLRVMNIENPENIELISIIDQGGGKDIQLCNDMLVTNIRDHVRFYNLDNPESPERIQDYEINNNEANSIIFEDDLIYCADGNDLKIYEINNRDEPEMLCSLWVDPNWSENEITFIFKRDDYVYANVERQGLHVIDVSDPEEPELVSERHLVPRYTIGMYFDDETMYAKDETRFQRVYDISDPLDPQQICEVDLRRVRFDGLGISWHKFYDEPLFLIYDSYLYSVGDNDFYIFNCENPANLTLEDRHRYHGSIQFAFQYDQYYCFLGALRYVPPNGGSSQKTIMVYDFSDPLEPEIVFMEEDLHNRAGGTRSAWRKDDLLFQMADHGEKMIVYNMENPRRPDLLGQWPDGFYDEFFIYRDYCYCFNRDLIHIYTIEEPLEPELVNRVEFEPSVYAVTLDGEIAFLDCSGDGLYCLSLDNPIEPEIVGFYDTPGRIETMQMHGDYLYIADDYEMGMYELHYEPGQDADFTIELIRGWNLVSAPFIPEDNDIENLFARLVGRDNLFMVKDHDGRFYIPDQNFNNIPNWDFRQGYQVKVDRDDVIWIQGEAIAPDTQIDLREGWSMAAYFPEQEVDAFTAFGNIENSLLLAKDDMGQFYSPEFNFSNMGDLRRGKGYQIKTSEETQLVWNVEQRVNAWQTMQNFQPMHFPSPQPTSQNMSLLIQGLSGSGEIGVFDSEGQCVGAGRFSNCSQLGVAVWGMNEDSGDKFGLEENEPFTLRYYSDNVERELINYDIVKGNGLNYSKDELLVLKVNLRNQVPSEFALLPIYPNPFNSMAVISYHLPEVANIELGIYDLRGRKLQVLRHGTQPAGAHSFHWNASALPAGSYLVRMRDEGRSMKDVKKVVLVK